jgi:hypothetical protein
MVLTPSEPGLAQNQAIGVEASCIYFLHDFARLPFLLHCLKLLALPHQTCLTTLPKHCGLAEWDETVHCTESTVETLFAMSKYKWGENQMRTKIGCCAPPRLMRLMAWTKLVLELYEKYVIHEE